MPRPQKGEKTPGSGRQKGTPNKFTQDLMAKCEASGVDLFQAFLELIKDVNAEPNLRFQALKEAAQYVYPKRKAIEHSTDEEKGFRIVIEDYRSQK